MASHKEEEMRAYLTSASDDELEAVLTYCENYSLKFVQIAVEIWQSRNKEPPQKVKEFISVQWKENRDLIKEVNANLKDLIRNVDENSEDLVKSIKEDQKIVVTDIRVPFSCVFMVCFQVFISLIILGCFVFIISTLFVGGCIRSLL